MRTRLLTLFVCVMVVCFATMAQAQDDQDKPQGKPWAEFDDYFKLDSPEEIESMQADDAKAKLQQKTAQESRELGNALADFKRGAGLGITVAPNASDDQVDEAFVVDDKIVVTKQNTNAARMLFEFHQLFTTNIFSGDGRKAARTQLAACETNPLECPMYGVGPFMALQMSEDDLVASVGVGIMLGVRNDPRKNTSFNFGIGLQWDSKVKQLADGFKEGQALPTGETEIRFKEKGEARLMFGISLGF